MKIPVQTILKTEIDIKHIGYILLSNAITLQNQTTIKYNITQHPIHNLQNRGIQRQSAKFKTKFSKTQKLKKTCF